MAKRPFEKSHFLHISHRKHRKEYRRLKHLFRDDAYVVKPNQALKDKQLFKYWKVRRALFSKIDEAPVYMTNELWYSVTPEVVAKFLAKFIRACLPNATRVMDVFCGAGGNTIQFAKLFPRVYGVDASLEHLYCTYRNARSYDVSDRIWLKHATWERVVEKGRFSKLGIDCVFGSPPWGGPQYLKSKQYDLETNLEPMGITEMLRSFSQVSSNIVLFLPRNSNLNQLSRATRTVLGPNGQCRVIYVKDNGFLKGILCMWGQPLISPEEDHMVDGGQEDKIESQPRDEQQSSKAPTVNYDVDG